MNKTGAKKPNILLIVVAALLALVIIFGAVMLIITAVRESGAVMKYDGVYMSRGVASFLCASYKTSRLNYYRSAYPDLAVGDRPLFWATEVPDSDGVTFGQRLERETILYLKKLIGGVKLFERNLTFTSSNEDYIKGMAKDLLDSVARGSEDEFNRLCAEMGFTYSDMLEGSRMIYKYNLAEQALMSESILKAGAYPQQIDAFYSDNYVRVKLLVIRTEDDAALDSEGKPLTDGTGGYIFEELSESEARERQEEIALIRDAIDGKAGGKMNEEKFDSLVEKYNSYYDYKDGYYFSDGSDATVEFATEISREAVELAFSLTEEEPFGICEVEGIGAIVVYKCEKEAGAYASTERADFFGDFYANAGAHVFGALTSEIAEAVQVKESFYEINLEELKYNTYYKLF